MNKVKIVISGTTGIGKSSIARLIEQTLKQYDIKVNCIDDNGCGIVDEATGVIGKTFEKRLKAISEKTKVLINTQTIIFKEARETMEEIEVKAKSAMPEEYELCGPSTAEKVWDVKTSEWVVTDSIPFTLHQIVCRKK